MKYIPDECRYTLKYENLWRLCFGRLLRPISFLPSQTCTPANGDGLYTKWVVEITKETHTLAPGTLIVRIIVRNEIVESLEHKPLVQMVDFFITRWTVKIEVSKTYRLSEYRFGTLRRFLRVSIHFLPKMMHLRSRSKYSLRPWFTLLFASETEEKPRKVSGVQMNRVSTKTLFQNKRDFEHNFELFRCFRHSEQFARCCLREEYLFRAFLRLIRLSKLLVPKKCAMCSTA